VTGEPGTLRRLAAASKFDLVQFESFMGEESFAVSKAPVLTRYPPSVYYGYPLMLKLPCWS